MKLRMKIKKLKKQSLIELDNALRNIKAVSVNSDCMFIIVPIAAASSDIALRILKKMAKEISDKGKSCYMLPSIESKVVHIVEPTEEQFKELVGIVMEAEENYVRKANL